MEKSEITHIQLMQTTFVCVFSPVIRLLPTVTAEKAGNAAWVSVIIGGGISMIYVLILWRILAHRGINEGFSDLIIRYLGKTTGKAVCCIFGVWTLIYAGVVLRASGERLMSAVFGRGNIYAVMALIVIVSYFGAADSIKCIAGSGSTIFIIVAAALAGILLTALSDIKPEYVLPIGTDEISGAIKGGVSVFNVMTVFFYTAFLTRYVKYRDGEYSRSLRWSAYIVCGILGIVITTIGRLSAEVVKRVDHPFFMMVRNISVFGVIERIESVVIGVWVLTDYIYLAVLMKTVGTIYEDIIGKKFNGIYTVMGAIIYVSSIACGNNFFDFKFISEEAVPIINLILTMSISGVLFVAYNIREGKRRKKEKHNDYI